MKAIPFDGKGVGPFRAVGIEAQVVGGSPPFLWVGEQNDGLCIGTMEGNRLHKLLADLTRALAPGYELRRCPASRRER